MNVRKFSTDWRVASNQDCDLHKTRNLDWVMIPGSAETWMLRLDYPLAHEFDFTFDSWGDMTKKDLLSTICQIYRSVYDEPSDKYGIWGHDIGDLIIEGVTIDFDKHLVTVGVGS